MRRETTPEDIRGMHASVGVLTERGGATSHAATVLEEVDEDVVPQGLVGGVESAPTVELRHLFDERLQGLEPLTDPDGGWNLDDVVQVKGSPVHRKVKLLAHQAPSQVVRSVLNRNLPSDSVSKLISTLSRP